MSESIKLDELYKVVSTANTNQDNKFCPVILEVVDPELKIHYLKNYKPAKGEKLCNINDQNQVIH